MTLRFDKRVRDNWGVNANYTYGRLMDNQFGESNTYSNRNTSALDNYDLEREWGYSLLDVPHRVTGALSSQRFHTPTGVDEVSIDVARESTAIWP